MAFQKQTGTARSSAALAAAGAFDTSPTALDMSNMGQIQFFLSYTRGAAGGSFDYKIELSPDGTNWYQQSAADADNVTTAADTTVETQRKLWLYKNTSASAEKFASPIFSICSPWVRINVAEVGDTANPGTVAIQYFARGITF